MGTLLIADRNPYLPVSWPHHRPRPNCPEKLRGATLFAIQWMVVDKKEKGTDKGTAGADKEQTRYVMYISQQFQCADTNCQGVMSPLLRVSEPTSKIGLRLHKRFLKLILVFFMMKRPWKMKRAASCKPDPLSSGIQAEQTW